MNTHLEKISPKLGLKASQSISSDDSDSAGRQAVVCFDWAIPSNQNCNNTYMLQCTDWEVNQVEQHGMSQNGTNGYGCFRFRLPPETPSQFSMPSREPGWAAKASKPKAEVGSTELLGWRATRGHRPATTDQNHG